MKLWFVSPYVGNSIHGVDQFCIVRAETGEAAIALAKADGWFMRLEAYELPSEGEPCVIELDDDTCVVEEVSNGHRTA